MHRTEVLVVHRIRIQLRVEIVPLLSITSLLNTRKLQGLHTLHLTESERNE